MYKSLLTFVERGLKLRVSPFGLGVFRFAFGLVALQEILFLFYFRHLIFDPVPYFDRASPVLHFFLLVWAVAVGLLTLGYRTRKMAFINYCFWVVFVVFTPMWQDFDGGFDQLMTGTSFLLIFLPTERGFSLDNLRWKLKYSLPSRHYQPPRDVPVLAYTLPLAISLGLLYFDSGLHKLSAEFWRNGMGAWLPATMPYYVSPIDMSPLLNLEVFERITGYSIILFQLGFLFLMWFRLFRVPLLVAGILFHLGIILSLNVYPFGFAMLCHYVLLVPFRWWRSMGDFIRRKSPALTVFYDQQCPLCNKTVITIRHFDVMGAIDFRGLQDHARNYKQLDAISDDTLLTDLYAINQKGAVSAGIDTYIRILKGLGYTAPLGYLMSMPGFYALAARAYRSVADGRTRLVCDESCESPMVPAIVDERPFPELFDHFAGTERQRARRIAKFLVMVLILQLNSTIHYGVLYRWAGKRPTDPALAILDQVSDSVINFSHTFFGISPHALYMHDHFQGYNRIIALTYRDKSGQEVWLPFVNTEGRLETPNWGRVQSMWANVAVTSKMSPDRLEKFIRKVTAFYAVEMGIDLADADFVIKQKEVRVPVNWESDLRHKNMAAPWHDVGKVSWNGEGMKMHISEPDRLFFKSSGGHVKEDSRQEDVQPELPFSAH